MPEQKPLTVTAALLEIQAELKAPKSQFNKFGNYAYRSCEDVLEAVKPLLKKYGCIITLKDEVWSVGSRYYIKATAKLEDAGGRMIETSAYAREPEIRKGMDESQITGASSSYARKYALNGLFAIDDTKDADVTKGIKEKPETVLTIEQMKEIAPLAESILKLTTKEESEALGKQIKEQVETKKISPQQAKFLRDAFVKKVEELTKK